MRTHLLGTPYFANKPTCIEHMQHIDPQSQVCVCMRVWAYAAGLIMKFYKVGTLFSTYLMTLSNVVSCFASITVTVTVTYFVTVSANQKQCHDACSVVHLKVTFTSTKLEFGVNSHMTQET